MALTLDANLAAAQDQASRHPLVEILSLPTGTDIPFDGTFLTTETFNEYAPAVLAHSSGRLIIAYSYFSSPYHGIKFVYTDESRQTFSFYTITESVAFTISALRGISLVELADGSVGIVYMLDDSSGTLYRLIRRVVPVTGGTGTRAEIANWSQTDALTSDPWCIKLGAASYAIYYSRHDNSDGHYHFYKRASADFATWGAEAETGPGSFPAGIDLFDRTANPSLTKVNGGDVFLFFDLLESTGPNGEELTNCFYAKSSDDGASWSAAARLTNYTAYSQVGEHPVALQKTATSLHVLFTLKASSLCMDSTTTGWVPPGGGYGYAPVDIMFDAANRKLYVLVSITYVGRAIGGIVKVDVDTWTVDKYWNTSSVPALDEHLDDVAYYGCKADDPYMVVLSCIGGTVRMMDVLNVADETITHYYFTSNPAHGITANVTGSPAAANACGTATVVASLNRIYMVWSHEHAMVAYFQIGYIDLTETTAPYEWHALVPEETNTIGALCAHSPQNHYLSVWPEEDMLCFSGLEGYFGPGHLRLYSLSTGALIKGYNATGYSEFPWNGVRHCCLYGGRIWAGFPYHALHDQEDFRGLVEVDYISDVFTFHRPSWEDLDDYQILDVRTGPTGQLVVCHHGYGVSLFDIGADSWELFSAETLPGLTPTNEEGFTKALYDEAGEQILAAHGFSVPHTFLGIVAFSQYGAYRQSQYSVGTLSGTWSFGEPAPLVEGYHDYAAAGVPDPDDPSSMYVFWENSNPAGTELSVKWDKDASSLDVSPYLVAGTEVVAQRSIDGRPGVLSFVASHGHLFDPYNQGSLFSIYLKKGRRLTLRWGEKVGGTDHWQNAGTFYVTKAALDFERGQYPVVEVEAQDRRVLWANHHIYATQAYENLPIEILEGLMQSQAGFEGSEMDFPSSFDGQVTIQHQWVDTTLDEIVNQICNRFGYYFRLTVDNKASARKISDLNMVDHAYADLAKIIRFSPDDTYSDFTNRVTVQGQERSFTEVLFAEERVGVLHGTVGWWGYRNDFDIYYSDDKERTCKNPRLVVIESATSIGFRLSGSITESISYIDPLDKYCIVTVSAPNLVPLLVTLIMLEFGAILWNPDPVQVGLSGSGFTIPVAEGIRNTILMLILMILASTGNYQYEIWAQPTGKIRRSVQSTADDLTHQAEIALVVEKKIEDPLCYSVPDCAAVAAFELMVARLQRRRISLEKVAHLQDEEGDTITFPHPYSGQTIKAFITDLRRSMVIGEPGSDNGGFFDSITGWVVNQ